MRMAKIQMTDNAKCWWGYRATGTLTYCWWECKVVQPLWKTVWWFLPKLNTLSPYDSAVAFPGIYPKELKNYIHIKTCTQMFTAASFIMTAHTWKQPRWTDKYTVLHPDNGMLFSAKKKWVVKSWKKWINLKCILISKKRQSEMVTHYIISVIGHSGKGKTMETVKRSIFAKD